MTNTVAEAVAKFDAVTQRYAKFGASDTEPRAEFTLLLERLYFDEPGNPAKVPSGVKAWQLFSGMKGAGTAAYALSVAARQVVKAAKEDPAGLRAVLKKRYPSAYDY